MIMIEEKIVKISMFLELWAESIRWLVRSLFPCGRLDSLLFVHGQNLSQEATVW